MSVQDVFEQHPSLFSIGYGGVTKVHKATKISKSTIHLGKREIAEGSLGTFSGIRKKGGGRKSIESKNPGLLREVEAIADINSIGSPENPLRWTTKSLRNITEVLNSKGVQISYGKVRDLLKATSIN